MLRFLCTILYVDSCRFSLLAPAPSLARPPTRAQRGLGAPRPRPQSGRGQSPLRPLALRGAAPPLSSPARASTVSAGLFLSEVLLRALLEILIYLVLFWLVQSPIRRVIPGHGVHAGG